MDGGLNEIIRDVDELKSRVRDIEFSEMNVDGESSSEPCIPPSGEERQIPVEIAELPTAFVPIWKSGVNGESGKWTIYLPDGCVKVDKNDATFEESGTAASRSGGYADLTPSAEIWCVVNAGSESGCSYKLASAADYSALFSFKVCTFDDELKFPKDHVTVGMVILKKNEESVSASSPFKYTKTTDEDPQTHQTVTTHKLVNCKFYWQGTMQTMADFDVSGILAGGSVWLVGTQSAPSASVPNPSWSWAVSTSEGTASEGGKVLNYKLYDFAGGVPTVDYRTTFLSIEDHTQKAKLTIGAQDASDKTISLDSTKLGEGENVGIHTLTLKGGEEDGSEDEEFKILSTDDIEIEAGASAGVDSVNGADGAITIIGGENIAVEKNGQTIKISYQEGKEADPDPNEPEKDPCDHPDGGGDGVSPGGGGGGGGSGGGGVHPGGDGDGVKPGQDADGGTETHPGSDCNCEK